MTEPDLPGAAAPIADDALASPLTAEEAAHFLRRTAFVARAEDVQKWTGRSWQDALAELVDAAPEPRLVNPPFTYRRPNQDQNDTDAELLLSTEVDRLVGSVGLGDRMLWFWHNIFTSSASSVDQPVLLFRQHQLLARHSLGSLRQLAIDISTDPAMLIFLNGDGSSVDAPNENYAREMMELFTLGRGKFSQSDVVAGARVLAGWEVKNVPEQPGAYDPNAMRAIVSTDASLAGSDTPGLKNGVAYLGASGIRDIPGLVAGILAQPAAATFLAHKLCTTFVQAQPTPDDEEPVAAILRASDFQIRPALSTLFRLPSFRQSGLGGRVRQPLEVLLQTATAFGVSPTHLSGTDYLDAAGQMPFDPPNVAGWPLDPRWLTSPQALARLNLGLQAFDLPDQSPGLAAVAASQDPLTTALQRAGLYRVSDRTRAALAEAAAATNDRLIRARTLLALAIASPEMAIT